MGDVQGRMFRVHRTTDDSGSMFASPYSGSHDMVEHTGDRPKADQPRAGVPESRHELRLHSQK